MPSQLSYMRENKQCHLNLLIAMELVVHQLFQRENNNHSLATPTLRSLQQSLKFPYIISCWPTSHFHSSFLFVEGQVEKVDRHLVVTTIRVSLMTRQQSLTTFHPSNNCVICISMQIDRVIGQHDPSEF